MRPLHGSDVFHLREVDLPRLAELLVAELDVLIAAGECEG